MFHIEYRYTCWCLVENLAENLAVESTVLVKQAELQTTLRFNFNQFTLRRNIARICKSFHAIITRCELAQFVCHIATKVTENGIF